MLTESGDANESCQSRQDILPIYILDRADSRPDASETQRALNAATTKEMIPTSDSEPALSEPRASLLQPCSRLIDY